MGSWGVFRINGKQIGSCCRECKEKYSACHDSCEKFLEQQRLWEEKQRKIDEAKKASKEYDEYHYRTIGKCRKARLMKGKGY